MSLYLALGISLLITQLDHPRFITRERAANSLRRLMPASIPQLQEVAGAGGLVNISKKARLLLYDWWEEQGELAANMLPDGWDKLPYIDSLPYGTPGTLGIFERDAIISLHLREARAEKGDLPDFGAYRYATRLYLKRLRKKMISLVEIQELLNKMRDREIEIEKSKKGPNCG